jgi:predicted kinase
MSKLILMVGTTASGKSTYAKTHMAEDDVLVSRDVIRRVLYNGEDNFHKNENIVTPVFIYEIVKGLKEGKTVWFEAVNDTPCFREKVLNEIEKFVIADELETIHMNTSLDVAPERNATRTDPTRMPDEIVEGIYNNLVPPTVEEFSQRGYQRITLTTVTTERVPQPTEE